MPTIVHFEIPSDDIERSKKFYNELFGWNIEKWPGLSEGMEYWLISTVDDKGNKALGGGMMKRQSPQQHGINYFGLEVQQLHNFNRFLIVSFLYKKVLNIVAVVPLQNNLTVFTSTSSSDHCLHFFC